MSINHASFPGRLTRRNVAALACLCLSVSLAAAESPPGTRIEARLLTPISTYRAKPGMEIAAAVATPVCAGGASVLPKGTELRGVVKRVHKVGLGLVYERAGMKLEFTQLHLPDGREYTVAAHLAGIDNARERVDGKGTIHGIRVTATLSNRFGERMFFAALGHHPASMIPLFVLESSLFHFPDPEIDFRHGTEMQFDVEFPEEFGAVEPCPLPEVDASPEEWAAMQQVVNALPYWTYSKRQRQPMDLVNLLFVGSQGEVEQAFAAAGWIGSRANSMRAGAAAIRAIAEQRGFSDAPMRTLLLDGQEPDFRLQKSLDTFEKRDHLRIWKRDGELDGRPVWASAATRDLGTTFGMHPFGFTHEVQSDVDLERHKVVHDLTFTGCVDSVAYVQRPEGVRETGQDYRKGVSTDARVAVVTLNGCTQPREDFGTAEPLSKPSQLVRLIRRVTLTARNHFIRDNPVYRTADAIRLSYLALRSLNQRAKQEGRARQMEAAIAEDRR
jgi:hypothetical protein